MDMYLQSDEIKVLELAPTNGADLKYGYPTERNQKHYQGNQAKWEINEDCK
jgi:hypothetical protein